eukprot:scaffold230484_cov29-Tisochrysis_lutea.AAC.1
MEQLLGCPTCPSFSQEEEPVVNRMEQKDRGSRACLCDLIQGGVFDWARDRPVIHYGCGLDDWHLRCEDAAASAATSAFQVRILLGRARPAEGGGDGPSDVLDEVDQQSQNHGYPSAEGRESERERERGAEAGISGVCRSLAGFSVGSLSLGAAVGESNGVILKLRSNLKIDEGGDENKIRTPLAYFIFLSGHPRTRGCLHATRKLFLRAPTDNALALAPRIPPISASPGAGGLA